MTSFYSDTHYQQVLANGLVKSVVNLSLTISCDPTSYPEEGIDTFTNSVVALTKIITTMHDAGIMILAAAGNEGNVNTTQSNSPRPELAYPANRPEVIGVGATDIDSSTPTCYSNQAEIFAPGGAASGVNCEPAYRECENYTKYGVGDCPYALVGLSTAAPSGIAYWAGSSFATPLVSGLMALSLGDTGVPITFSSVFSAEIVDLAALEIELESYLDSTKQITDTYTITTTGEVITEHDTITVLK